MHVHQVVIQVVCFREQTNRGNVRNLLSHVERATYLSPRPERGVYTYGNPAMADKDATSCTTSPYRVMIACDAVADLALKKVSAVITECEPGLLFARGQLTLFISLILRLSFPRTLSCIQNEG